MQVNIETKFDVKDKVFLLHDNKIVDAIIERVHISRHLENTKKLCTIISYEMKWSNKTGHLFGYKEDSVFATKEELVKSLL